MARLSDDDRHALLDELRSLKDNRAKWGIVASTMSIPSAFVLPALIPAFIGVAGIMAGVLTIQQNAVEHKLADPPRTDFTTRTRARSRRYWPGTLGDSQLALATDQAVLSTLRVASLLDASVRADERAQGAELHGREDLATARDEEAMRLMEQARAAGADQAVDLNALGMAWAAAVVDQRLGDVPIPLPGRPIQLPPRVRRAMRRAGLAIDELDLSIDPTPNELWHSASGAPPRFASLLDLSLEAANGTRELARVAAGAAAHSDDRAMQVAVRGGWRRVPAEYERGLRAIEAGELDRAEQLLRQAAELGSADATFELGRLARRRDDAESARRWFELATELNPPRPRVVWLTSFRDVEPPERRSLPSPPELRETSDEDDG